MPAVRRSCLSPRGYRSRGRYRPFRRHRPAEETQGLGLTKPRARSVWQAWPDQAPRRHHAAANRAVCLKHRQVTCRRVMFCLHSVPFSVAPNNISLECPVDSLRLADQRSVLPDEAMLEPHVPRRGRVNVNHHADGQAGIDDSAVDISVEPGSPGRASKGKGSVTRRRPCACGRRPPACPKGMQTEPEGI